MALLEAVMDCGFGNWWESSGSAPQCTMTGLSFLCAGSYWGAPQCTPNVRWLSVGETHWTAKVEDGGSRSCSQIKEIVKGSLWDAGHLQWSTKFPQIALNSLGFEGAQLLREIFCAWVYSCVKNSYRISRLAWLQFACSWLPRDGYFWRFPASLPYRALEIVNIFTLCSLNFCGCCRISVHL